MENNKESFEYTYSAEQQAEIEKIKAKYICQSDDKLAQLRKLDASVLQKATMTGIIIGVIGCLVFGGGMSIILVASIDYRFLGIVLGILGIVLMGAAYPVFKKVTEKESERIAPQILALTEELGL